MKIKYKYPAILSLFLAGFMIFSPNLFAQPGDGPGMWKKEHKEQWEAKVQKIHQQLNLTAEQEEKLKANRTRHKEEMAKLFESIRAKRGELSAELQKPELDMGKVNTLHSTLKELKAQKEDLRLKGIMEAREILTGEQFSQFLKLKEKMKAKHRHGPMKE